jgi:hypothetical protein
VAGLPGRDAVDLVEQGGKFFCKHLKIDIMK